jgi:hypothetical protein
MNTKVCEMRRIAKDAVGTAIHSTYTILLCLPFALKANGNKCWRKYLYLKSKGKVAIVQHSAMVEYMGVEVKLHAFLL